MISKTSSIRIMHMSSFVHEQHNIICPFLLRTSHGYFITYASPNTEETKWRQFSPFQKRDSTQVLLCPFPGVLWLWHFLYSVGPHSVSSLHIYTFVVSRTFMAVVTSQAGDADSSRTRSLISGLQGSVNVHRGALLLVPQWRCISTVVFYMIV